MSSPLSAQPLKVTISGSSSKGDQGGSRTPVASRGSSPRPKPLANPADISSPHELTAFVRSCPPLFPPPVHGVAEENFRSKHYWSNLIRSSMTCLHKSSNAVRCHVCGVSSYMTYGSRYMRAVMQMSQRVDALEASIQDIINGEAPSSSTSSIPSSPSTTPTTLQSRRTRSGLQ